ncbi:Gamma tubulin complex component protein, N-terminal [Dillenia turbinata]|uniref:Gamma-tubulin complex component n=1 Tax=Dillenia turbinata TaxID=194707 RepID=A0AAN8VST5_9MAGN
MNCAPLEKTQMKNFCGKVGDQEMGIMCCHGENMAQLESSKGLIDRIHGVYSEGIHFAALISSSRTSETDLVRAVLQILQGLPNSLLYWDPNGPCFCTKGGMYLAHLSQTSLYAILNQFMHAATCLKLVEDIVSKVESSSSKPPLPTLKAFLFSASAWLKKLRNVALNEEVKISNSESRTTPTLLGLASSLSSLCAAAEFLLQVVYGAIPESSVTAAEMAFHILDHLYKKLNEVCLMQSGEEAAYQMLLYLFVGTLLPYVESLDSWLFEGVLDDPSEEEPSLNSLSQGPLSPRISKTLLACGKMEGLRPLSSATHRTGMFFHANKAVAIDEADFWEKSYLLRPLQNQKIEIEPSTATNSTDHESRTGEKRGMPGRESSFLRSATKGKEWTNRELPVCPVFLKDIGKAIVSAGKSLQLIRHIPMSSSVASGANDDEADGGFKLSEIYDGQSIAGLTLAEVFCVSLVALTGNNDHISRYFLLDESFSSQDIPPFQFFGLKHQEKGCVESKPPSTCSEKIWSKFLAEALLQKKFVTSESACMNANALHAMEEKDDNTGAADESSLFRSFHPENPVITVCQMLLDKNKAAWSTLNLSKSIHLPPLNDEDLRATVFCQKSSADVIPRGTDYTLCSQFGDLNYIHSESDIKMLEEIFPFPTLLPSFQEEHQVSELLPFQNNSTLPSKVLNWIQTVEPKATPLPLVLMQECLVVYIKNQVDFIGKHILSKLMNDWRLMDELRVLRAIYLLGSGDLLQHFLTIIFDKLDKGETWEDDFELNTILQESIRNSSDRTILSAPDSLIVSISKHQELDDDDDHHSVASTVSTPKKGHDHTFGINGLDILKFTYKVSWPLELIANTESIRKYNQVMNFLLKVRRAKFVLDKTRRWMWKGKGMATINRKRHWLVEQKLLHFVDAFHQYVMDRVYHSAWCELCEGMGSAGSLDEVIEVHEAYLLSIQRQCFVVPEKLWALLANRINSILGLALDFYSVQKTLSSGGAVSAIKARCEKEVDRIEKKFDDCIAFLLRVLSLKLNVGHFPHLADLVTRVNYNYFYLSESGNLIIAPGSETVASKMGKASQIKTD